MTARFLADVLQRSVWLILLIAVFVPLERLFAIRPIKLWRKQFGIDLGWYFVNGVFSAAIFSFPLAAAARLLTAADPMGYYSAVAAWPLWLKMVLTVVLTDIGAYWGHRAMHAHPTLWRFHAVHHSAEELDWLVNTRAHPFDLIFTRFAGLAPVYLLGLSQTTGRNIDPVVAGATIFSTFWTFFIHSNIRVRLGPLEWVISSPAFHHWHHTNDKHRDRNFAFVFPVIDRFFGTAWLPKYWPTAYGVDEKISPTMAGQFFDPLDPCEHPTAAASLESQTAVNEAAANRPRSAAAEDQTNVLLR